MPDENKEIEYVKDLARRAFRNVTRFEDNAIEKVEERFDEPKKNILPKNGISGLTAGLAIGIVVCVAATVSGIPFNRMETVFITAQFGLLGALMTYINS